MRLQNMPISHSLRTGHSSGRSRAHKKVVVLTSCPWLDTLHGDPVLGLFKALAKLGFSVKIVLPSCEKRVAEATTFSISTIVVKKYIPFFSLISICMHAMGLVSKERDFILIFDSSMLFPFLLLKAFRKCEGIMMILSRPLTSERSLRFLLFRLMLMLGKGFVKGFTAISPFEADEFSRLGKIPTNKITLIPSPLGKEFEKPNLLPDGNWLRLKLGQELSGKKLVLYQGALDRRRGILELLRLFHKSFKKADNTVLVLLGNGDARDHIRDFIISNHSNNIILLDPVPHSKMPEIIGACDVGLVLLPNKPAWRYQCPTKLIEFLALRMPVIASDLPSIRWIAGDSSLVSYVRDMADFNFTETLEKTLAKRRGSEADNMRNREEIMKRFSSVSIAETLGRMLCSD